MIVIDTDVIIDFLNGKGANQEVVRAAIAEGRAAVTAITRYELMSGAKSLRAREALNALFQSLRTLQLDAAAADEAAQVRRSLAAQGVTIGNSDSLVAGIVRLHGHPLLTRNKKHFERVEGLALL